MVVAIDGPAGAGKSAAARALAQRLGLPYLDTGAMYRAVAVAAALAGCRIPPDSADDEAALAAIAAEVGFRSGSQPDRLLVEWRAKDLSAMLRTPEASRCASVISAVSPVRRELVRKQRELVSHFGGGVVEGRDIGTVVFPDAPLKVFLTASPDERARRRWRELADKGGAVTFEAVLAEQHERDQRDANRSDSPLRPAPGAEILDSTHLSLDQVVERLVHLVGSREGRR